MQFSLVKFLFGMNPSGISQFVAGNQNITDTFLNNIQE